MKKQFTVPDNRSGAETGIRGEGMEKTLLKPPVEVRYQGELEALKGTDTGCRPENWQMSPRAVRTFILGSPKPVVYEGKEYIIEKKYFGNDALVERCIVTLAGNRGLMLVGEPGTAKTMLSELLSAAISGVSTNTIQGTAGTTEDMIKYSWNYALLLAKGPSREALVPAPLYIGMEKGILTRFEEITRTPAEIQDSLISVLSDKVLNVPELGDNGFLFAKAGFNVIGTANTRDKGVNEMSAALKRRFNIVVLPAPADLDSEMEIVRTRVAQLAAGLDLNSALPEDETVEKVCRIFRELRCGETIDRSQKVKGTSGVLSTAEAISLLCNSMALAGSFGSGKISDEDLAAALQGAIIKDEDKDAVAWKEYLEHVMKKRGLHWSGLYKACSDLMR